MANGTIAQPPITGTRDGWTYLRVGNNVIAWSFNQRTNVTVSTAWASTGLFISGELEVASLPTFLKSGYRVSGCLAVGSQSAGVTLGRVMEENNAIRVYLQAPKSQASANCAIMVFAVGEWNGV